MRSNIVQSEGSISAGDYTRKIAISLGHSQPHPAEYLQRARKGPAASPLWRSSIRVLQKSGRRIIIIFLVLESERTRGTGIKRKGAKIRPPRCPREHDDIARAAHSRLFSKRRFWADAFIKKRQKMKCPGATPSRAPPTNETNTSLRA
jgi:hypothetical protein